jgi:hypothetical protein
MIHLLDRAVGIRDGVVLALFVPVVVQSVHRIAADLTELLQLIEG